METSSRCQAEPSPGLFRRAFGWLVRWRTIRLALIGLAVVATLIALAWTEENWRGRRDWEAFKVESERQGERFDMASFLPKPVPDDQNLAATPFLAPFRDYTIVNGAVQWRDANAVTQALSVSARAAASAVGKWEQGRFSDLASAQTELRSDPDFPAREQPQKPAEDVLFALEKYQAILTELRAASERPFAVYSSQFDDSPEIAVQKFVGLKSLGQLLVLHASANLEAGHSAEALSDVKLAFRLGDLLRSKPLLLSHMVRIAILRVSLQPIWEGLANHRWTDEELQQLQKLLDSARLLEDYGTAMRAERAFSCEVMAQYAGGRLPGGPASSPQRFRSLMPRGLLYQNQIAICELHRKIILAAVDANKHRVYPALCASEALPRALGKPNIYNIFARLLFPALQKAPQHSAMAQTGVDLAVVACALERYRLAHGEYPEGLAGLMPSFLDKLPQDVVSGRGLNYRRDADGQFALYSVGWNDKDDGGQIVRGKSGSLEIEKGDWVWRYSSDGP